MRNFDDLNPDNFDEFDEFGKFSRSELNRLLNNSNLGEQFLRKRLGDMMRFDFESMFKTLYGLNNNNPRNFNMEEFTEEDGWIQEKWKSPDGKTQVTTFHRSFNFNPFMDVDEPKKSMESGHVIKLLEEKLSKAITEERYEDAASIRDTINDLKKDEGNN